MGAVGKRRQGTENYYGYSLYQYYLVLLFEFRDSSCNEPPSAFFCMHKALEYLLSTTPLLKEGNGVLAYAASQ